jgi:hypothetical protein
MRAAYHSGTAKASHKGAREAGWRAPVASE